MSNGKVRKAVAASGGRASRLKKIEARLALTEGRLQHTAIQLGKLGAAHNGLLSLLVSKGVLDATDVCAQEPEEEDTAADEKDGA